MSLAVISDSSFILVIHSSRSSKCKPVNAHPSKITIPILGKANGIFVWDLSKMNTFVEQIWWFAHWSLKMRKWNEFRECRKREENVCARELIGFIAFRAHTDLNPTQKIRSRNREVSACHITVKYCPKWPLSSAIIAAHSKNVWLVRRWFIVG